MKFHTETGPTGAVVWTVRGATPALPHNKTARFYWRGPGSRLYLLLAGGTTVVIDHASADGNYSTRSEANAALRRFLGAPAKRRRR